MENERLIIENISNDDDDIDSISTNQEVSDDDEEPGPNLTASDSESESEDLHQTDDDEISSINNDNEIKIKPSCLIILDLLFWLLPSIKVFGGTVRDILADQESHHLHVLIDNISENSLIKRLNRLIDTLEINGYSISFDQSSDHRKSKLSGLIKNLIHFGLAQAIVSKYGSKEKKIKLLLVTNKRMNEYQPVFRCDLLYLTKGGNLHLREGDHFNHMKAHLSSQKLYLMREVLRDIEKKQIILLDDLKIRNGYRNRFIRSKIAFKLIRLQERGWTPKGFDLSDCGLNISVKHLRVKKQKTLIFPNLKKVKDTEIFGNPNKKDDEENLCPICREVINSKSSVETNCKHHFHNRCIFQHFYKIGNQSSLCPICRSTLVRELPIDQLVEVVEDDQLSESELEVPENSDSNRSSDDDENVEIITYARI